MNFNMFIKRWSADPNQPGNVSCYNISVFSHRVILFKAIRQLPRRLADRVAGPGAVAFGFGHAFADSLDDQLVLHFSHGAQNRRVEILKCYSRCRY